MKFSNDYNPVAVFIQKCTLEYPQLFGSNKYEWENLKSSSNKNPLLVEFEKWGKLLLSQVKFELGEYYPNDPDGSTPVGYIWARALQCQNPLCGIEIPLLRQFWLSNKPNKKISLYPYLKNNEILFKIVGDNYEEIPQGFDPSKGTIIRASITCPACGSVIDDKTNRKLFREGKTGNRMIAVVLHKPGKDKTYRISNNKDIDIFEQAETYLNNKRNNLLESWGIDPIPNETLPLMSGVFNVPIYGIDTWGKLFNSRQNLALITIAEKIRNIYNQLLSLKYDEEYAKP